MNGILTLVESKREPAFETPLEVCFTVLPRVGESFLFTAKNYGHCNTSEVKAVDSETGAYLLTTRNSLYRLIVDKQEAPVDGQVLATGTKKDDGKARWDLLPFEVINAVADILTRGAKKYAARNWEQGITYGRVYAGVMRHLAEWWICKLFGRDGINRADGPNSHIDHAICGLMFLSAYEKRNMVSFDDRPGVTFLGHQPK